MAIVPDVTIARLIVGKRHCRVLTLGNINSDATGFDIICRSGFMLKIPPAFFKKSPQRWTILLLTTVPERNLGISYY